MPTNFWESLRGYDKWPETEATVESSSYSDRVTTFDYNTESASGLPRPETTTVNQSTSVITWKDASGNTYRNQFTVTRPSPLFEKYAGDKLPIRYNPANPRDFYIRELRQGEMSSMLKMAGSVILALAAAVYWYMRHIH